MARLKLFSPSELDNVTLGQLMDMVTAWAPLDAAIQTAKAEKDRRGAEFDRQNEEQYKLDTYAVAQEHSAGLAQIMLVMSRHPQWFGKGGRVRVTDNAEFGYVKERDTIRVADVEALKKYADTWGLKLYNSKITPILAAVKRELKDVDEIPGVEMRKGEDKPFARAVMRNLDEARKGEAK